MIIIYEYYYYFYRHFAADMRGNYLYTQGGRRLLRMFVVREITNKGK